MILLLGLAVLVLTGYLGGRLATVVGLPAVIGQMTFGIMLSPLALGAAWPGMLDWLFPQQNRPLISVLGSAAAGFFVFQVGAGGHQAPRAPRRDVAMLAGGNALAAIALTLLALPVITAITGYGMPLPTVLFMAVAFTVCALPVLAQLMESTGLTYTRAGQVAIAIAAATDVAAWCAIALLDSADGPGWAVLALSLAAKITVVGLAWRLLRQLTGTALRRCRRQWSLALVALACAATGVGCALLLDLDPILGAFAGGLLLAAGRSAAVTAAPAGPVPDVVALGVLAKLNSRVMLPVFFASIGLSVTAQGSPVTVITLTVLFVLLAMTGRVLATAPMARWTCLSGSELRTICCLISARGATEIIILNLGQRSGLIPAELYTPMVLMALTTTIASGVVLTTLKRGAGEGRMTAVAAARG